MTVAVRPNNYRYDSDYIASYARVVYQQYFTYTDDDGFVHVTIDQIQPVLCSEFYKKEIEEGDEFMSLYKDMDYLCPNTTELYLDQYSETNSSFFQMEIVPCQYAKDIDTQ